MRKFTLATCIWALLFSTGIQCTIFHTSKFADVATYVKECAPTGALPKSTVIVCDIDDVLGTNGADCFFYK